MESDRELIYSLSALAKFALSNSKVIRRIVRIANYNDEPKTFTYFADYALNAESGNRSSWGSSFNKKRALVKVLGEALERYCLNNADEHELRVASKSDLRSLFLDPSRVPAFSKKQREEDTFRQFSVSPETKFRWVKGKSLNGNSEVYIPAQLVYTNYQFFDGEPHIRFLSSTGAAAHMSLEQAIYNGICEAIERDSFMIHYLNRITPSIIDLDTVSNNEIRCILQSLARYDLELKVLEIATDLQIPAYAAILIDRTGNGPAISMGLKAGFDMIDSIRGAIEETLMSRTWLRDNIIYKNLDLRLPGKIETIEQRAFFWFNPDTIDSLQFLFEGRKIKAPNRDNRKKRMDYLEKILRILQGQNLDGYYVDITQREIREAGFVVVKVFIPGLCPIYFDENYPYYGMDRLYDVPVKLGLSKTRKSESDFNQIPHPFL